MLRIVTIIVLFIAVYNLALSQEIISKSKSEILSYDINMAPRPKAPSEQCKEDMQKLNAIIEKQKEIITALQEELKKCKEMCDGKPR